jgi:hypothetical protein
LENYETTKKHRGFKAPPAKALTQIPAADRLILNAYRSGHGDTGSIASLYFIRHGKSATYQVSWTTDEGRKAYATIFCYGMP